VTGAAASRRGTDCDGRPDFAAIVFFFNQMTWIAANEPVALFDFNGNSRIDFADVVWLFNQL
jgi:PKD repeat protein